MCEAAKRARQVAQKNEKPEIRASGRSERLFGHHGEDGVRVPAPQRRGAAAASAKTRSTHARIRSACAWRLTRALAASQVSP